MVTFMNMGRCGNFLFQAATALGYSIKHGLAFTVPTSTNNPIWNPIYFPHLINGLYDGRKIPFYINEKQHAYQDLPSPDAPNGNVILRGYWQSYKYFDFCRDRIIDAFQIPYTLVPGTVGLHVRRGDYLQYPTINPLATREYYEKAVKEFWLRGYKQFLVFSDDIEWCKKEFQDPVYKGLAFQYRATGTGALEDISALSGCEHMIASNSTFAWWGAWLNRNPEKIVICPHEDNYYGPDNKHLDVSTLYPPEWLRIAYQPPTI